MKATATCNSHRRLVHKGLRIPFQIFQDLCSQEPRIFATLCQPRKNPLSNTASFKTLRIVPKAHVTMSKAFSHERLIAELAVQRASVLAKRVQSAVNKGELSKTDSTPVTIADFAAQAILISAIHHAFPEDKLIGEEDADALRKDKNLQQRVWELVSSTRLADAESETMLASPASVEEMLEFIDLGGRGTGGRKGRVWMMDPIDGTDSFLLGQQYAVALALVEDGEEKVGVLGYPNLRLETGRVNEMSVDEKGLGLMLSAVKGEGAVMRPMGTGSLQAARPIERSKVKELKDLNFVDCATSESLDLEKHRQVAEIIGASWPGTDLWSSQVRYGALIVGGGDVMLRIHRRKDKVCSVWDHAGGQLIFREVGGKITDLDGKEIEFGTGRNLDVNMGMVAAREWVHARILQIVQEVLKG
jgi:3'(2'), 5'-bisphosphate nucleotidase